MLGNKNNLDWGFYVETDKNFFFFTKCGTQVQVLLQGKIDIHQQVNILINLLKKKNCLHVGKDLLN